MAKKVVLNKEVLVESFKKILGANNICWRGAFALKRNSISDMAYLSWQYIKDDNNLKAMDSNIVNMDNNKLWDVVEDSIRYWGLKHLLSLAQ